MAKAASKSVTERTVCGFMRPPDSC
jgi:hypothetical protein